MRPIAEIRADIAQMVGDDYPLLYLLVELENAALTRMLSELKEEIHTLIPPSSMRGTAYSAWIRHRDQVDVIIDANIKEYDLD